jgi:hypothetical protein
VTLQSILRFVLGSALITFLQTESDRATDYEIETWFTIEEGPSISYRILNIGFQFYVHIENYFYELD